MEKRKASILFLAVVMVFSLASCTDSTTNSNPNIIMIYADDMGYGDLASYGATGYITPNFDKMAAEGTRFTNFYSVQAVCSASRAALMTGCYSNRIGISHAFMPDAKKGLHDDELTIAEMLREQGYATGMVGKWHLGHLKPFLPLQHGFDSYFGIPYSNDMWPVDYDGKPITEDNPRSWKLQWPTLPIIKDNEVYDSIKTLDGQDEITTRYTEHAVEFIRENAGEKPFFLYFAHSMPHVPLGVSDKFRGKSEQGLYGDVMMEMDWSLGELIKTLEETGQDKNTLIIFSSDNGPWINFGNHAGSTGGLREGKGTSFEGGQREPCIMWWPDVIPSGKVNNELSATIDVLPTLAELTGAELPDHKIDGLSLLSMVRGETDESPRTELYYYYQRNSLEAVRKGNYKLVLPHKHRSYESHMPGNDGYPGPTHQEMADTALYDLIRDPGERYDVKSIYPEKLEELLELAEKAREDLGDDITRVEGNNRREAGIIK